MSNEASLEKAFIETLENSGYIYRKDIRNIESLNKNFIEKVEETNNISLSQKEGKKILDDLYTHDVFDASLKLRDKYTLLRDDETKTNLLLYNTQEWCKNIFEVVNQFQLTNERNTKDRYDIAILINGIPMVHIELKNYNVYAREAMEQIAGYKERNHESIGKSLFCFTQLFIVSNGHSTYYFANNNLKYFKTGADTEFIPVFQWACENNKKITNLNGDFASTFLEKCFLSKMIARYIVLRQAENKNQLVVLRPYQVHAVESIIKHIENSNTNGFIWHTTGSGKTLTSFKCATILRDEKSVDKVLFVVDRKDLDKQTVDEFNKFEGGCVDKTERTENTKKLLEKILDTNIRNKVIVTTLQKLTRLLEKYSSQITGITDKKFVFIFDECHRSQFGESNKLIRTVFKNSRMFGFTGTPIFEENSNKIFINEKNIKTQMTTKDIFGDSLHNYLIHNAIEDKNVLKFQVHYFNEIDRKYLNDNNNRKRKEAIVQKIIDDYNKYSIDKTFNSIFATSSITDAMHYYDIFKEKQKDLEKKLKITAIYSKPNSFYSEDLETERKEYEENDSSNKIKENALKNIIEDYNKNYKTNSDIVNAFDGYYDDVSNRMKSHYENIISGNKNKTIDILIVVDMFLTGFDSPYTNTLFVDKNLKQHGLIQAFSRTNRTVNALKKYGNILTFTDIEQEVDKAILLFSNGKDENKDKWLVRSYKEVLEEAKNKTIELKDFFLQRGLAPLASSVANIQGDKEKKELLAKIRDVVSSISELKSYALFDESKDILSKEEILSYKTAYNEEFFKYKNRKDSLDEDENKEMFDYTLELFRTVTIDWDYIQELIRKYCNQNQSQRIISKNDIMSIVTSDVKYALYKDIVSDFIDSYENDNSIVTENTDEGFKSSFFRFMMEKENRDWETLIKRENLNRETIEKFRDHYLKYRKFDFEILKGNFDRSKVGLIEANKQFNIIKEKIISIINLYDTGKEA